MYMSRIQLNPPGRRNVNLMRKLSSIGTEHDVIWEFFNGDPDQDRDFLYRRRSGMGPPRYLVVSERKPQHDGPWSIETKHYDPDLREQDRLFFDLRFNCTLRSSEDGRRHDVVMHRKHQLKDEDVPRSEWPSQDQMAYEEGVKWLQRREDHGGYELLEDSVVVMSHNKHEFEKDNGREVTLSTMDVQGECVVRDPSAVESIVHQGLGPAKAYGCGLLLVALVSGE